MTFSPQSQTASEAPPPASYRVFLVEDSSAIRGNPGDLARIGGAGENRRLRGDRGRRLARRAASGGRRRDHRSSPARRNGLRPAEPAAQRARTLRPGESRPRPISPRPPSASAASRSAPTTSSTSRWNSIGRSTFWTTWRGMRQAPVHHNQTSRTARIRPGHRRPGRSRAARCRPAT